MIVEYYSIPIESVRDKENSDVKTNSSFGGGLGSYLNQLCDEDVAFIYWMYIKDNQELYELFQVAILHNCIKIHIRNGDSARTIYLDLPCIRYVLYAPEKQIFPLGLIVDENILTDDCR